jgi:hypothetical protein
VSNKISKRVGEVELKVADLPQELKTKIAELFKLNGAKRAGRPNILQVLQDRGHDPHKIMLEIIFLHFIEKYSLEKVAERVQSKYGVETTKMTISNLITALDKAGLLGSILDYAQTKVERKVRLWWVDEEGRYHSDVDYIESWLERHRHTLKMKVIQTHLRYLEEIVNELKKLPHEWNEDDIARFLNMKYEYYKKTIQELAQKNHKGFYGKLTEKELDDRARENTRKYLVTIRRFLMWVGRSDLAVKFGHSEWKREYALIDYISLEEWKKIEASELFTSEEILLLKLHITVGCREGHKERSGLSGLRWSKINWKTNRIDVYESKVKGGLIWQGCSLELFWPDLPEQLKNAKRKNDSDFIVDSLMGFNSLNQVVEWYSSMNERLTKVLGRHYRMHFNRKTHAIWLIEADVALEVIAGKPSQAFFGVGWEDVQVLLQHYGTFTEQKVRRELAKVQASVQARLTSA